MKRELKKAQTRQKIAEAAVELFGLHGYETTTVQQIAERAAVAKGTFFNYFNSKEELMMELQGMVIMKEIETVVGKPGPVVPRLQAVLFEYARNYPMSRSVTRAVLQGIYGSDNMRNLHCLRSDELQNSLVPVVEHAQHKGEVRSDLPAGAIAQLAVQTYFGVLMSWALGQGEQELSDQMALSFEIFVQGISP